MAVVASTPAPVMREGLVQVGDELLPRGLEPQELCDRVRASPSPFLLSPTSERLFVPFSGGCGCGCVRELPNPRRVWGLSPRRRPTLSLSLSLRAVVREHRGQRAGRVPRVHRRVHAAGARQGELLQRGLVSRDAHL